MLAPRALRRRAATSLLAFLLAATASSAAIAADPLNVTTTATLEGVQHYSEVTIRAGAKLSVKTQVPDGQGNKGLGNLHLIANKITVEAGGIITAGSGAPAPTPPDGAGYLGVNNMAGEGQPMGAGLLGVNPGDPGGGGAYGGNGGGGTDEACALIATSVGGTKYPTLLTFGSAGGAANVNAAGTRGGNGGGVIILEAAIVELLGTVEANGDVGFNPSGVGSGAGAGGAIQIIAFHLITDAASTVIIARGGKGGDGTLTNGGGGGGGRIVINGDLAPVGTIDAAGGDGGQACPDPFPGRGEAGVVEYNGELVDCLDADQDTYPAVGCGGTDCDDADPEIHPGADEECDGIDNNCTRTLPTNGIDDEIEANLCPDPQICQQTDVDGGKVSGCVNPPDAGSDAGDPNAAVPDQIALKGGCALGGSETGGLRVAAPPLMAAAASAAVLALLRRRRRRSP